MSPERNDRNVVAVLESLRPAPDPEFTKDLDARAAEGFPRKSADGSPVPERWRDRLAGFRWSRAIAPAGAVAVLAVAIATAAVSITETETNTIGDSKAIQGSAPPAALGSARPPVRTAEGEVLESAADAAPSANTPEYQADSAAAADSSVGPASGSATAAAERRIERSAQVVLEAEPSGVREAAGRVFGVIRDHDGIVLRSAVRDRRDGGSLATFDLLIPGGELDEALADFSEIATVRSRSDSTVDVTAPTVSLQERLRNVRADIDRLLTELAEAEMETDREAIERRLRAERGRAAHVRSRLDDLEERVRFSRVSLRIVSGEGVEAGGSWGIDDAVDDAGRILAVAAGVTLIGLAILAPLALIALLAWVARRAWTHRARERALDRGSRSV